MVEGPRAFLKDCHTGSPLHFPTTGYNQKRKEKKRDTREELCKRGPM